jgi:hypothetical protein
MFLSAIVVCDCQWVAQHSSKRCERPAALFATVLGDGAIKGWSPAKKVEIGQAKVKNCQLAVGLSLAVRQPRNAAASLEYEQG